MKSKIEWALYRSFLGVLREGSLSNAARVLGVAQPTVGRHISTLESALGLVLFTRSQTGLMPTDVALALRSHAEAMENTAAALERAAASIGEGIQGVVRITASEVMCVAVLPQVMANLRARHPKLEIELLLSNNVEDLLQRAADIAVRMVRPTQAQLVAQRVDAIGVGLHAHPAYLARCGTPSCVDELTRHTLIGYDTHSPFARAAIKRWPKLQQLNFALRTNSDATHLALIRAGAGIGFCQTTLAQRTPSLVRILPSEFDLQFDTWITMHEDLRSSPRCRVTFDALVEALTAHSANTL